MEEENDSCPLIKTDECTFAYIKVILQCIVRHLNFLCNNNNICLLFKTGFLFVSGEQRVHRGDHPEQHQHRDAVQSTSQDLSGSRQEAKHPLDKC